MTPVMIGLIGIAVMLVLFVVSVPIAISMALAGLFGYAAIVNITAASSTLVNDFYATFTSYSMTAMPMFIFMGTLAFHTEISSKLYNAAYKCFGRLKGGLAIATVVACALFGAICGSSNASAAAMGKVALPEMKKYNYSDSLATGSVAAAGCLGILIPPSGIMIIYGIMTENNIAELFTAGIVPGIILSILYCIAIMIICKRNPLAGPGGPSTTIKEKLIAIGGAIDMVILFLLVIGGMFLGWFTPTQSGAIGAAGAILLGLIRRTLTWERFKAAVFEAVGMSCMVMAIVAAATMFGHFMAISRIPTIVASFIENMHVSPNVVMLFMIVIYFIGGCFMDSLAMILLTLPIFYPIAMNLGFSPIFFCIVIVVTAEMGLVTPPVGLNVYIIGNMRKDVPLTTIFKGAMPYLACMWILIILLLLCPGLATWLPGLMYA